MDFRFLPIVQKKNPSYIPSFQVEDVPMFDVLIHQLPSGKLT